MADTKRRFYNTGDAKGFTKEIFFSTVRAMAYGDVIDDDMRDLVFAAAQYELEGMALKSEKSASKTAGEAKDPLQSEYALALKAAIAPLVSEEPMTGIELGRLAAERGIISKTGKPYADTWISRVLNRCIEDGEYGIVKATKMVTSVSVKTGKRSIEEKNAYAIPAREPEASDI